MSTKTFSVSATIDVSGHIEANFPDKTEQIALEFGVPTFDEMPCIELEIKGTKTVCTGRINCSNDDLEAPYEEFEEDWRDYFIVIEGKRTRITVEDLHKKSRTLCACVEDFDFEDQLEGDE